jgi:predicted naringenin-chalcone synthase
LRIAAVGAAFPPHYYDQEQLIAALRRTWGERHYNLERLEALHRNVLVGGRNLALPIEEYETLTTWGRANDAWIRVAEEVGGRARARRPRARRTRGRGTSTRCSSSPSPASRRRRSTPG